MHSAGWAFPDATNKKVITPIIDFAPMWKRWKSVCNFLENLVNTQRYNGSQAECSDHGSSGIVGARRRYRPRPGLPPLEKRGERHSQEAVSAKEPKYVD